MPPSPRVSARREVAENRFFLQAEEDLVLPDGSGHTYHQIEAKWDAVLVVPVLPDGRLLIERIYRHPYRRWFLEFPAGGMAPGDDACAAAARELEEETGRRAGSTRLIGRHLVMPGLLRMALNVVLAEGLSPAGPTNREPLELIELEELTEAAAWQAAADPETSSFLSLGLLYLARQRAR